MTISTERKPLEYYLGLKYPATFEEAPEGGYFIQIEDLPGCYAQGETVEGAKEMIEIARRMWLGSAYEDGQDIPEPRSYQEYSGKFNVRLPRGLHRKLNQMAKREGVSLNQFLVSTLSLAVGQRKTRQGKARSAR